MKGPHIAERADTPRAKGPLHTSLGRSPRFKSKQETKGLKARPIDLADTRIPNIANKEARRQSLASSFWGGIVLVQRNKLVAQGDACNHHQSSHCRCEEKIHGILLAQKMYSSETISTMPANSTREHHPQEFIAYTNVQAHT